MKTKQFKKMPRWSKKYFVPSEESKRVGKAVECKNCDEVKIPLAYHPMNKKIKFCSLKCGKVYMVKNPDTRYVTSSFYKYTKGY